MSTTFKKYPCFILAFLLVGSWIHPAVAERLVSLAGSVFPTKTGGNGDSGLSFISADGRYVLFASTANNLTGTNNNNATLPARFNVFLRDTVENSTALVSVNQSGTGGGDQDSFPTGVSANGQFALFESSADDLVPNDTNNAGDIFVRDVINGTTTLVSTGTGGANANGASRGSVITPDGRYVAFVSLATNLVAADTNNIADVFVRDLQAGTTTLVSVGASTNSNPPVAGIASSSESPEITPDGHYVAFYSTATNLLAGVKTAGEIYVRDLVAGKTLWASTNARAIFQSVTGGTNIVNCNYSLSDDGRFVAYEACTNTTVAVAARGIILRYNLQTGLTEIIHTNTTVQSFSFVSAYELVHDLAMTPDGRFVTYPANLPTVSATNNAIYCWDAQTGSNTLVSVSQDNATPANGIADSPVISADGRLVAFTSSGTNLTGNPLNGSGQLYLRDIPDGTTALLNVDTNGTGMGVDATTVPAMSADGSIVAFDCANLLPENRHLVHDVFARNVTTSTTSLISAADPGLLSLTPDGITGFTPFAVSSNGQFVAFYSDADDLTANDTNGYRDVFVRDVINGTNDLVSVNTNGNASGDNLSTDPAISADGRYVAFTSAADNLVPGDTNRAQDVFVRDRQAGTTTLVSVSTNGINPGNGDSFSPMISADGRFVLFHSTASNLAAGNFGKNFENLFFRDLQTGTTYPLTSSGVLSAVMTPDGQSVVFIGGAFGIVGTELYVWNSEATALTYTNSAVFSAYAFPVAAISANGQKVAYAANLPLSLYIADVVANTVVTAYANGFAPSHVGLHFSDTGRFLTYAMAASSAAIQNVYCYDSLTGTNLLVSQNFSGTAASANSDSPAISPDGRFIAYRSFATNIVPFDGNNVADLFIYDVSNNASILASVSAGHQVTAAGQSLKPVFSADGQTLFYESWASDLTGNDYNQGSDLFALDLMALPLTDATGGGATNAASGFFAQLIPTGGLSSNSPALSWPLAPGKSYQVQYKTNLNDAVWLNLPGDVTFVGSTGYLNDTLPSPGQRFYRIVLSP